MEEINKELCAKCGGACCKNSGCLVSVRDCKEGVTDKIGSMITEGVVSLYVFDTEEFGKLLKDSIRKNAGMNYKKAQYNLEEAERAIALMRIYKEVYIVKMRSVGREKIETIIPISTEMSRYSRAGQCTKLTPSGCEYSDSERPYGGLKLIPRISADGKHTLCKMEYSMVDNILEWLPFHCEIRELFYDH